MGVRGVANGRPRRVLAEVGRLALPVAALAAVNIAAGRAITGPLAGLPEEAGAITALRRFRGPTADSVARVVSTSSDVPASIALAVASIPALRAAGLPWRRALVPAVAMALETVVYLAAGAAVGRERPPVERLDHDQPTSSFPSGHVGATVALMVALGRAGLPLPGPARPVAGALGIAYPAVLSLARVYVGMHYPSDVIAGVLNGLATGTLAAGLADRLEPTDARRPRPAD